VVQINYRSNENEAARVVEEIKNAGGEAVAIKADVSTEASVVSLFEKLDAAGLPPLTALVNNAGIGGPEATDQLDTASTATFDALMACNALGPLVCCREAAKRMPRGSAIVNLSSISATGGTPLIYAMTKGAVISMQRGLVGPLGAKGIRINSVSPGLVTTDMTTHLFQDPEKLAVVEGKYPLGRFGEPDDIAGAVSYLLSRDASWTSGTDLLVAGGVYPQ